MIEHACQAHFHLWLKGGMGTGCGFAGALASRGNVIYWTYEDQSPSNPTLDLVEQFIDSCGSTAQTAVVLFPRVRSVAGLVAMLDALAGRQRWTVEDVPWDKHERADAKLVGVRWRTREDLSSSVGGFAPLLTMPATRRAPYVAIAVWPGKKLNPIKKTPSATECGFVDAKIDYDATRHKEVWDETMARVKGILADPAEDIARFRQVAFCIPRPKARPAPHAR